jgi:hypothetical protein
MPEREYRKLDLNNLPRKVEDIDLLCDAARWTTNAGGS